MEIARVKALELEESISRLEKLESDDKEAELQTTKDIRKAEMRAKVCRSNSAYFRQSAQESDDPGFQRVCVLEAEHFGEMARCDEEHAARLRDLHSRRVKLRQRRTELVDKLFALREKTLNAK